MKTKKARLRFIIPVVYVEIAFLIVYINRNNSEALLQISWILPAVFLFMHMLYVEFYDNE